MLSCSWSSAGDFESKLISYPESEQVNSTKLTLSTESATEPATESNDAEARANRRCEPVHHVRAVWRIPRGRHDHRGVSTLVWVHELIVPNIEISAWELGAPRHAGFELCCQARNGFLHYLLAHARRRRRRSMPQETSRDVSVTKTILVFRMLVILTGFWFWFWYRWVVCCALTKTWVSAAGSVAVFIAAIVNHASVKIRRCKRAFRGVRQAHKKPAHLWHKWLKNSQ